MKEIHWFPGHMKKALNNIESKLKLVDVMVEILDARAPKSSRNCLFKEFASSKKRLLVFSKKDLADEIFMKNWCFAMSSAQNKVVFADLNNNNDIKNIIKNIENLGHESLKKDFIKGLKRKAVRAIIIGIPNVGKSTLINRIVGKKKASVENRPGKTRSEQWIKINEYFELLDTPGVLPMNYEDKEIAKKLALLGSIKESILPTSELVDEIVSFLKENYPNDLKNKYHLESLNFPNFDIITQIGFKRGFLLKGKIDIARTEATILADFRNGKIAKICLDRTLD